MALLCKLPERFGSCRNRAPLLSRRRGGCAIKRKLRSHISSRRRGGVVQNFLTTPPRPATIEEAGFAARFAGYFGGESVAPSCRNNPSESSTNRHSAILPFSILKWSAPDHRTCLPVAGIPSNSPVCVPWTV